MGHPLAKLKGHFREDQPSGGMKNLKEENCWGGNFTQQSTRVGGLYGFLNVQYVLFILVFRVIPSHISKIKRC